MKRASWWAAGACLAMVGCGSRDPKFNPNEKDFPGAPGSSVPAPPAQEKSAGGGDVSLPSSYPGIDQKPAKAADAEAPKDAPKAETKAEKKDVDKKPETPDSKDK